MDLKNYPLGRNLPYSSLDKVFNKYCSVKSIEEGLAESERKYSLIKDELSTNSQARLLFFKRYKKIILDIKTEESEMFCKQKVMGYSLLKKIQHEKIIKQLLHPCLLPICPKKKRLKPDSSHEKKFDPEN